MSKSAAMVGNNFATIEAELEIFGLKISEDKYRSLIAHHTISGLPKSGERRVHYSLFELAAESIRKCEGVSPGRAVLQVARRTSLLHRDWVLWQNDFARMRGRVEKAGIKLGPVANWGDPPDDGKAETFEAAVAQGEQELRAGHTDWPESKVKAEAMRAAVRKFPESYEAWWAVHRR